MPAAAAGRALFLLAQTDPLRVYVNVPQAYAQLVKPGQQVVVTQAELRGQTLQRRGRAHRGVDRLRRRARCRSRSRCRTATACCCPAPTCRSRCRWQASRALVVPTNALLFRGEGTRVAVVDADGQACALRRCSIGRNYGETVEVLDGIARAATGWCSIRPTRWPKATRWSRRRRAARHAGREGASRARRVRPSRRALSLAGCVRRARLPQARGRGAGRVEARGAVARRRARRRRAPRGRGGSASAIRSSTRCSSRRWRDSPTLAAANARLAQARALRRRRRRRRCFRRSAWPRAPRGQRISANRPLTNYDSPNFSTVQNDFVAVARRQLRGRPRRPRAAQRSKARGASAEQSAADLENTRLLLTADLATAYFNLRATRHRARRAGALDRAAAALARASSRARHDLGAASGLDVAQQQALLDTHADPGRRAAAAARRSSSTRSRR